MSIYFPFRTQEFAGWGDSIQTEHVWCKIIWVFDYRTESCFCPQSTLHQWPYPVPPLKVVIVFKQKQGLNAVQGTFLWIRQKLLIVLSFLAVWIYVPISFWCFSACFLGHLCPFNELFLVFLLIKGLLFPYAFHLPSAIVTEGNFVLSHSLPHTELFEFSNHDDTLESISWRLSKWLKSIS